MPKINKTVNKIKNNPKSKSLLIFASEIIYDIMFVNEHHIFELPCEIFACGETHMADYIMINMI